MKPRPTILAMAACAMPWLATGAAHAQPIQGFYAALGAGPAFPLATKVTPLAPGFTGAFDFGQSPGAAAQIAVGYALGNGWRLELEGTWGRGHVSGSAGTFFPATASGTLVHRGIMANALFDLDIGSPYIFPYVGLGAGYQSTRLSGFTVTRSDRPFALTANGEAGGFALQGIAGLAFPVPYVPGLSVTADYRIQDILGGLKFSGGSTSGTAFTSGAAKFHNQFQHGILIGLRFAFDTPPPPAGEANTSR